MLDYVIVGGVTDTQAVVSAKHAYSYTTGASKLKLLRIDYDGATLKGYVNGVQCFQVAGTGNLPFINNLLVGSDGDEVDYLFGYVAELLIYNGQVSTSESQQIEHFLADKWLETGTDINGYLASSQEGVFPNVVTQKWFHIDESGVGVDEHNVPFWDDKAQNKRGRVLNSAIYPIIEPNKFKGKQCVKFDGNLSYKFSGFNAVNDADFFSLFLVYAIDDFDFGANQTIIGDVNDTVNSFNSALIVKKYASDDYIDVKVSSSSAPAKYAEVPRSFAYEKSLVATESLGTIKLQYSTNADFSNAIETQELQALFSQNGVCKFILSNLQKNTKYYYKVFVDNILQESGEFKTFKVEEPLSFTFVAGSCNHTASNAQTWTEIANENPLFVSHLGDFHYQDIASYNKQLFRDAFNVTARQPNLKNMLKKIPFQYVFDDHDYGANNSDRTSASRSAVISFYEETVPSYPLHNASDGVYHAFTAGRVRFICTDMRSNRDPFLASPDDSPTKTMLGATQKLWLKNELLNAKNNPNIGLICWLNPSPWTGDATNPYSWDYGAAGEHWTNYLAERQEIHQYIVDNAIKNVFIINGDTHQQAIDDGRNSVFAKDANGQVLDWKALDPNLLTIVIESSPFDKDVDNGSGQFQINEYGDSGKVAVKSEKTYTLFKVNDNGYNWIEVEVYQYALPDGITYYNQKTLVNKFSFIRDCQGTPHPKKTTQLHDRIGHISGYLTIRDSSEPIEKKYIEFLNPTSFDWNYKGSITAKIINMALDNLVVKVYRRADIDYEVSQAGGIAVNSTTGEFTYTGSMGMSQLVFKLFHTNDLSTPIQVITANDNSDYYSDLRLDLYYVTDIEYFQFSQNVKVGGTYRFDRVNLDKKFLIKLFRKSTNKVLSTTVIKGELPRSYSLEKDDALLLTPFAHKAYTYDSALALICTCTLPLKMDLANRILKGILAAQLTNGSFPFSVNHINPIGADAYVRNGATAWVAYSLAFYLSQNSDSEFKVTVGDALVRALEYLKSMRDSGRNNLIKGGSGRYTQENGLEVFDPTYVIPWVSTEHNIDAYFAFKLASQVLNSQDYANVAASISTSIQQSLYDTVNGKMFQGIGTDGNPDTSDALDINSWGAMFWHAIGRNDIALQLLQRCEDYYKCIDINTGAVGYKPYSVELGYPDAVNTVWFEGSFGVAMAYAKLGENEKYSQIIDELQQHSESDGSFRYATLRDTTYEITTNKAMASTCWSIMANVLSHLVWV